MDRRAFLRGASRHAAKTAVDLADQHAEKNAANWIRPPYALPEIDFLLSCTRCNACLEACPQQLIFPLSSSMGMPVVNTPALDLLNSSCLLCEDWPCVQSCEAGALQLVVESSAAEDAHERGLKPPKIANVCIDTQSCLPWLGPECGACAGSCPIDGALAWDGPRPMINQQACVGCAQCVEACILDTGAILISSSYA